MKATVIGAGLAGCEAAWQLSQYGIEVTLREMKPKKFSPAHHSPNFGELVCSNSLRSDQLSNAVGLLKEEMRRLGSLIMRCADETRVEAGSALAVDREEFSKAVTNAIHQNSRITVVEEEVETIPDEPCIVATGPLTSDALCEDLKRVIKEERLYFYDAAAPIVTFESIDMNRAYFGSRYGKGTPDYINCPMTKEEYEAFYKALITAKEAPLKEFETLKVFEGCMPVEEMAKRGEDTLRFGPLKPVGLPDPSTQMEPYAVVQLRKDNKGGTLYNIVGFQTHLTFEEQKRVFSMIPGLERAEFVRYGVMHRNTFINSPKLLDNTYRLKSIEGLYFAGQITGVEGYVESASSGLVAGLNLARRLGEASPIHFPPSTAIGALAAYISDSSVENFQPMNVNFGIMEPLGYKVKGKQNKKEALSQRALYILDDFISNALYAY
jgi:methylenetetrahydrofolate--tRNA-(uracil-5-)-methyltransferase